MSNRLKAALLRLVVTLGSARLAARARQTVLAVHPKVATAGYITGKPQRQLLVDVSIIAAHDAGTGIQRVVRSLLTQLIASPPSGFEVRPVRATRKRAYEYADSYLCSLTGSKPSDSDAAIRVAAGDIFLGLDLSGRALPCRQFDLLKWRAQGVRLCFVVYDLLPLTNAQWFTPVARKSFRRWLYTLSIHADAVFCISRTVAEQTQAWRDNKLGVAASNLEVRWFRLGADLRPRTGPLPAGPPAHSSAYRQVLRERAVMMVGTLEPRKGHALVLDAFEILWANGSDATLVIAGKIGWHVESLVNRLRAHQQWGKRLIWLNDATDDDLSDMYSSFAGLIFASEAEGFGLPLIEAAHFGLPILARDIPVFREVAAEHATYFNAGSGAELAPQINEWLELLAIHEAPSSEAMPHLSWAESATQLKHLLADQA
ncbi:glycosyltransferase family 1 protein [Paraburkholderia sediminicola]|uniref:glycosyltransferase family 4 protein n=1 Tax=Paraburkholderia sediminicola TaxID=458836 RepID=UPI0038B89237